jgi:hypothetical protein
MGLAQIHAAVLDAYNTSPQAMLSSIKDPAEWARQRLPQVEIPRGSFGCSRHLFGVSRCPGC